MKNTMKKMISLLVALMMLMLSACAMAEETVPAVEENIVTRALDLLAKGYAITVEETVTVGEGINQLVSENDKEMTQTVKELLDGLKIRASAQMVEDNYQVSIALLFGEEKLGDLVISRDGDVLMVASNFLGQDPIAFTKDDLKKLLYLNVTVEGMEQPVNMGEQVVDLLFLDSSSFQLPEETTQAVVKATEELINQMTTVVEQNASISTGETLLIDGSQPEFGVAVKLSRDTLLELTKSFAANLATAIADAPTEEELKTVIDFLRSDLEIRVYPNDDSTVLVLETSAAPAGEEPVNMHGEYVIDNENVNLKTINVLTSEDMDTQVTIGGSLNVTDDSTVGFAMNMSQTANGKTDKILDMDGHFATTEVNNIIGTYGIMNMEMADTVKMKTVTSGTGKYTDDNVVYNQDTEMYLEPEKTQPAFIIHETLTIDLAEAYLNPELSLMFNTLDEQGIAQLENQISQNATVELMKILTVLPQSVLNLLMPGAGF